MAQVSRKVTVFKGTKKYLATSYDVEKRSSARGHYVTFKPKGARNLRAFEDVWSQTVIVDGWDHPEFDELLRGFADAPVTQLPGGASDWSQKRPTFPEARPQKVNTNWNWKSISRVWSHR